MRLSETELVCNVRWCVPTPLVHRLVHDALHLTTCSVKKHLKKMNHGVEGERLYKAVNCYANCVPHVPFTRMTTSASMGT